MTSVGRCLIAAVALVAAGTSKARATDQTVPGSNLTLSATATREKLLFKSMGAFTIPAPGSADDPTQVGATLQLLNPGTGETFTFDLPAAHWSLRSTGPAYKYRDGVLAEPGRVKIGFIRGSRLSISGRRVGITLNEASQGTLAVILTTGSLRYCAQFGPGSVQRDEPGRFMARTAPPPASCATAPPPTTSTTTTITTTTSTTSPAVQCCRPTSAGGAFLNCDLESAAACANGGMDAGPGTCSPNPCTGSTFTSTTATSTSTSTTHAVTTSTATSTTSTTLCGCCPSASSLLRFTNSTGTGNCGNVKDASGTLLFNLACGGLYTGGGASTLTQPASPPDMGTNYTRTTSCSGSSFNLVATLPADLTAVAPTNPHRFCTSAGVADPDYPACAGGANAGKPCVTNSDCPSSTCTSTMPGCLFGAPLAIPNPTFTGASVCVVNRVQTSATGSGNCATGATNLTLPLASDLYLTGDLLDGSAPDRPSVPGIQPCPLCSPSTNLCEGGPRNGLACHPDTSALNAAYPTSHDCPPPPGALGANYIGALPVPFNLTTDPSGTSAPEHLVANNTNASGQEVFCGFCGAQFSPTFHNPPIPCANDAACAGVTGCPSATACNRCKQRDSGAFGSSVSPAPGTEHEITLFGSPAGVCLRDGAPHASTLVSAFCIPPSFNATVDANGDLPGPGAVSLPGQATLIP